jgi:hypothetical protein
LLRDQNSPVNAGLYGPPLAGFAFLGFAFSELFAKRGNRAALKAECESSADSRPHEFSQTRFGSEKKPAPVLPGAG